MGVQEPSALVAHALVEWHEFLHDGFPLSELGDVLSLLIPVLAASTARESEGARSVSRLAVSQLAVSALQKSQLTRSWIAGLTSNGRLVVTNSRKS